MHITKRTKKTLRFRKSKVKYMVFDPDVFEKKVEISEQEIKDYYQLDPYQFSQEEQISARHILLKVKENAKTGKRRKDKEKGGEIT